LGRYKIPRRTETPIFFCLYCGKVGELKHGHTNKFCNLKCFNDYRWENVSIPKILEGKASPDTCKKYLLKKYGNNCMECGQKGIWNDKLLYMHMDHIDGNSDNNLPENLRLICPNCHTQTDTFCSKGVGNKVKKFTKRNRYLREYKGA